MDTVGSSLVAKEYHGPVFPTAWQSQFFRHPHLKVYTVVECNAVLSPHQLVENADDVILLGLSCL